MRCVGRNIDPKKRCPHVIQQDHTGSVGRSQSTARQTEAGFLLIMTLSSVMAAIAGVIVLFVQIDTVRVEKTFWNTALAILCFALRRPFPANWYAPPAIPSMKSWHTEDHCLGAPPAGRYSLRSAGKPSSYRKVSRVVRAQLPYGSGMDTGHAAVIFVSSRQICRKQTIGRCNSRTGVSRFMRHKKRNAIGHRKSIDKEMCHPRSEIVLQRQVTPPRAIPRPTDHSHSNASARRGHGFARKNFTDDAEFKKSSRFT